MLGKYINQFMADNELSVNEEFFIENMDGNRVLIGCADRYKIEDDATESAIYDEIVNTYIADDCEAIEQWIYDVTNIKVEEK